jgi:hypothetical protein
MYKGLPLSCADPLAMDAWKRVLAGRPVLWKVTFVRASATRSATSRGELGRVFGDPLAVAPALSGASPAER